jgi:hypothetical protein
MPRLRVSWPKQGAGKFKFRMEMVLKRIPVSCQGRTTAQLLPRYCRGETPLNTGLPPTAPMLYFSSLPSIFQFAPSPSSRKEAPMRIAVLDRRGALRHNFKVPLRVRICKSGIPEQRTKSENLLGERDLLRHKYTGLCRHRGGSPSEDAGGDYWATDNRMALLGPRGARRAIRIAKARFGVA